MNSARPTAATFCKALPLVTDAPSEWSVRADKICSTKASS